MIKRLNALYELVRISTSLVYPKSPASRRRAYTIMQTFGSGSIPCAGSSPKHEALTPKQVKREMNDAIIETLKRKIKALESENKELREQMKKAYAQIYSKF